MIEHDPYCLVDPVCISPTSPGSTETGDLPSWQGPIPLYDPLLITGNPIRLLALPNYVLFLLVYVGALLMIDRKVANVQKRRRLIIALGILGALEFTRWLLSIGYLAAQAEYSQFLTDPKTYVIWDSSSFGGEPAGLAASGAAVSAVPALPALIAR